MIRREGRPSHLLREGKQDIVIMRHGKTEET
jgi:hypothetical protein